MPNEEEYTGQWLNAEMTCDCCGKNWMAMATVVTKQLECPDCGYFNDSPTLEKEPFHVIISRYGKHFYFNTSRPANRDVVQSLLQDAVTMLNNYKFERVDTRDSGLSVFVTSLRKNAPQV